MDAVFGISSSALRTTQTRQNVTAHNVANINTDGFSSSRVIQAEQKPAGVSAAAIQKNQNSDPQGQSNTDFAVEATNMIMNKSTYGANSKVLKVQDQMLGELLNIVG